MRNPILSSSFYINSNSIYLLYHRIFKEMQNAIKCHLMKYDMVNIITRHGSRCPLKNYEMDESKEKDMDDFWNGQIVQKEEVEKINTLFPLVDVQLCPRTDPYGRLTKLGFNQMCDLGKRIRSKYINNSFLKTPFQKQEVKVKCSGFERTQQSAQAMLLGLLDITTENPVREDWYPVVHTYSPPPSIFDPSDGYTSNLRKDEELKKEIFSKTEEYTKVIPEISKYVNVSNINQSYSFLYQFDYYRTNIDNNYPIHPEIEKYKDIVLKNVEIYLHSFYRQPKVYKYCNEGILSLIYKNMINRLHNFKPLKLCILSGHDLTTACLMYRFNKEEASKKWPIYADNIEVKLYKGKDDDFYFEVVHNDKPIIIDGFDKSILPLSCFKELII